jgi:hypothetical protein
VQLLNGLGVVAQILLAANQDNGEALAEVENLGNPLKDRVSMTPATKKQVACCSLGGIFKVSGH